MIEIFQHPNGARIFIAGNDFRTNILANKIETHIFVSLENNETLSGYNRTFHLGFENRFGASSEVILQTAWKAWKCAKVAEEDILLYRNVVIVGSQGKNRPALVAALAIKYLKPELEMDDIIKSIQNKCLGSLTNPLFRRMLKMNFLYKKFDLDVLWRAKALERINDSYFTMHHQSTVE